MRYYVCQPHWPLLERILPNFFGPDTNNLFHRDDKNLPVSYAARLCSLDDKRDDLIEHLVTYNDLELNFRQKVNLDQTPDTLPYDLVAFRLP